MTKSGQRRITADKREIKDFPKLPSATSFIRAPLCEIARNFFIIFLDFFGSLFRSNITRDKI